jgi:hypothetical protein
MCAICDMDDFEEACCGDCESYECVNKDEE